MSNLVAQLNESFRVVTESGRAPIQWMLQRAKMVKGAEQWEPISFCQTREGLLLSIREKCIDTDVAVRASRPGEVTRFDYPGLEPAGIAAIKTLPDRFAAVRESEAA